MKRGPPLQPMPPIIRKLLQKELDFKLDFCLRNAIINMDVSLKTHHQFLEFQISWQLARHLTSTQCSNNVDRNSQSWGGMKP